jgi:large subunit ribosomal protein L7/L12
MLAVLELWDYVGLAVVGVVLTALAGSSTALFRPRDRARLKRIESKLDLVLGNLRIQAPDAGASNGLSAGVRQLADGGRKIEAIKLHREETGLGLKEAKDAVEAYMADSAQ